VGRHKKWAGIKSRELLLEMKLGWNIKSGSATYLCSFKFLSTFHSKSNHILFPSSPYLHLLPFVNSLIVLPMATRASKSKFDQHRLLPAGTNRAPSDITNKKSGLSALFSIHSFNNLILTIYLQVLVAFRHGSQHRWPCRKRVSWAARTLFNTCMKLTINSVGWRSSYR